MNVRFQLMVLLVAIANIVHCQQPELLMGRYHASQIERGIVNGKKSIHLGQKPYQVQLFKDTLDYVFLRDSSKYYSEFGARVMRDHLLQKRGDDYFVAIDVLMDLQTGKDFSVPSNYSRGDISFLNCRGAMVQGEIGKKFTFNSGLYEVQRVAPRYLDEFIDSTGVVPGWGRVKNYMVSGVDYSMSFGNVTYSLKENWNIQFGYGKHFIGHGYRSLLLTDGVFNAPYLKSTATFFNGKMMYSSIYTSLQSLERLPLGDTPESLFKRKGGSFHYLSFKPTNMVEIGFFEGTVWRIVDSLKTYPLPWNAYLPIIGVNSVKEGFDGYNNVYSGVNLRINLPFSISFYGQLLLDDPATGRTGFQLGGSVFDFIVPRLNIRSEYNDVGEFVYAAGNQMRGLSHFNQPLGHPSGGSTKEFIVMADYRWQRWFGKAKFNQIRHGKGVEGKWNAQYDSNSFSSDTYRNIMQMEITAGYKLNIQTNAEIFGGFVYRQSYEPSTVLMFGIRTNLHNSYFDF